MATWNPSDNSNLTLSNGNLTAQAATSASTWRSVRATVSRSAGKYYFEATANIVDANNGFMLGIANSSALLTTFAGNNSNGIGFQSGNNHWINGGNSSPTVVTFANGDVLGIAVDITNKLIWFIDVTHSSSTWYGSSAGGSTSPSTGTNGLSISALSASPYFPIFSGYDSTAHDECTLNTGTSAFSGTLPTGFTAWDAAVANKYQGAVTIISA